MRSVFTLVTFALAALTVPTAGHSAGPYDGTWVVDAPAVPGGRNYAGTACAAVRLQFQVRDNAVIGSLRMVPGTAQGTTVRSGPGRGATPIKGTVAPDGSLTAQWQSFRATGTLAGSRAELRWKGQCGPRVARRAHGIAVGRPAAPSNWDPSYRVSPALPPEPSRSSATRLSSISGENGL